jgi:hypothetical protein
VYQRRSGAAEIFPSDGLAFNAMSYNTMIVGILLTSIEECGSKAMLVLTLTFMHVFLFSVHNKEADCKQCVIGTI